MSTENDIREIRSDVKDLTSTVAAHGQQLQNGAQFRVDLDAIKEQRAGPRLSALEINVSEMQTAVVEQGHHVKALTGAFDGFAGELKAERLAKTAASEKALEDAAALEAEEKKDAADFRKQLRTMATSPFGLAVVFALLSALNIWKSDADKEAALEAFRVTVAPIEAPAVLPEE